MTTDVSVHVTVRSDPERAPDAPDVLPAPAFRDKVTDRAQIVTEVFALLLGLLCASWCVACRLLAMIAEWRASRRQARRLVVVVPAETDAWMRAYAARTGRELGEVVHDAIAAARSPEAVAALCEMTARVEPIIIRVPQTSPHARVLASSQALCLPRALESPPTLARVARGAMDATIRRLAP